MIISLYAAILALLYVGLTFKTIKQRIKHQKRIGEDGIQELQQHVRAHANFAEYVPFALLLLLILEMQNGSIYALHGLGIALVVGRLCHAYGLTRQETYSGETFTGSIRFRQIGMVLTLGTLIGAAIALLIKAI